MGGGGTLITSVAGCGGGGHNGGESRGNSIFVKWRTDLFLENEKRQLTSSSQFHELFLAN